MIAPPCRSGVPVDSFPGFRCARGLLLGVCAAAAAAAGVPAARAQTISGSPSGGNSLEAHYDAAQNFQAAGDRAQAALQYRMFLADAFDRLAHDHAAAGDSEKATPLFEEALELAPADFGIRVDYAEASLIAKDYAKARLLAEQCLDADPKNAKAHLILGRSLLLLNKNEAAKEQFEAAIAIDSNFENGFALATAYLALQDEKSAAKIFAEMLTGLGDSAEIHMRFGRAYADRSLPDQAIQEFKKAIAKQAKLPTAHYSLGAAYLQSMGEINDPQAEAEFRKELEINPNDFFSHFELGSIALTEHRLGEAEGELTRAESLNPQSPDPPLSLGEVYRQLDRPGEAEAELRKSISLTHDVSRNHYQIQRAYYMLGRLLLATDRQDEGKKAIEAADRYMQESVRENQGKPSTMAGNQAGQAAPLAQSDEPPGQDREALGQLDGFERKLSPAIADSYDNLGAIAAGGGDFAAALHDFRAASEWNPALEGLDYNWGRAAFSAGQYDQAVGPLGRVLQAHADDTLIRSSLGVSFFHLGNYSAALETLKPIEGLVDGDPNAALAYAISQVKAGDYNRGVERLKNLEKDNPNAPAAYNALGEAFASRGNFAEAARELRIAVKLAPSSTVAKYNLALALIGLQQNEEAQKLLVEVTGKDPRNADALYQLGKVQLDEGDTLGAVATLEAAERANPANAAIHLALAAAYRKGARIADSERETKLYDALRDEESRDPARATQN